MNSYRYFDYDRSFDGLMTVIFDLYEDIERAKFMPDAQSNLFDTKIFISADMVKATRVIKSLEDKFPKRFMRELIAVFLSCDTNKEDILIRAIKGVFERGYGYIFSSEKAASEFRRIRRNVLSENHSYKGLLRFKEVEGGVMLAEFAPKNDILTLIVPHFVKRFPTINFVIADVKRGTAAMHMDGKVEFLELKELDYTISEREQFFEEAWKDFYKAIAIDERKSEKLMISNMPKRYWRYLIEK